ncbi:lipopolysaccharide export system protein LptA [Shimia isoporae]|uniref:Lipopolysaccharide export system protein LptA n=1 Tax=Shimia isoporae TaxID=647720 RepID=A0A4R1N1L0_9RHOB|nr:lipopolysaccharide transport periplasmic protein LptA [Shimia isoporae]TCK99937.1 lipopolysaccharide export system protein LptA [Shimia isoporae]
MLRALLFLAITIFPAMAAAQGLTVGFGEMEQDSSLPVEVTSDSLSVNQNDGSAVFIGNVVVIQGEMRMTADKVNVYYLEDQSAIEKMIAVGDVLLVRGPDAAEGNRAIYSPEAGTVKMYGDVLVVQETTTIASDRMTVHLNNNTAEMHGRVKTILRNQ